MKTSRMTHSALLSVVTLLAKMESWSLHFCFQRVSAAWRWGAAVLFAALAMLLLGQRTASADCIPGNQVDKSAFFAEVARQLRNPSVPESAMDFAVRAFLAWEPYENTAACWNPLATTLRYSDPACRSWDLPGNRAGVQQYPSRECGIRATADTLNYTLVSWALTGSILDIPEKGGNTMKRFIVSILEPVLSIVVILHTLFGFVVGGFVGGAISFVSDLAEGSLFGAGPSPSLDFHFGWALVGGIVSFLTAVVATGAIFTLLAIKDLQEEQLRLLRQARRQQYQQ